MDFSQKYKVYAPNRRKKAKCVAEGTVYQNQLFHPPMIYHSVTLFAENLVKNGLFTHLTPICSTWAYLSYYLLLNYLHSLYYQKIRHIKHIAYHF